MGGAEVKDWDAFFAEEEEDDDAVEDGIDYPERDGFSVFFKGEWSTFFGPEWEGDGLKFKRGMFGRNGKLAAMGMALAKGCGIRETARLTGCSTVTVAKLHRVLLSITGEPFRCACGEPSTHQGWCASRFAQSGRRQEFMRRWHESGRPHRRAAKHKPPSQDRIAERAVAAMSELQRVLAAPLAKEHEGVTT